MTLSVGFVISHPSQTSLGSLERVNDLIHNLSDLGVECHIFTPFSYTVKEQKGLVIHHVPLLTSRYNLMDKLYNLIRKTLSSPFWCRNFILRKKFLEKMINDFANQLFNIIMDSEIDIIHGVQEIAAAACVKLKESFKKPVFVDFQNIWAEELVATKVIKKTSQQYQMVQNLEERILKTADRVTVDYTGIKEYMKLHYNFDTDKVIPVPLGGIPRFEDVKEKSRPFKVAYIGLVNHRAHVDLFVNSMPLVLKSEPETNFFITKKGELLNDIMESSKNLNVSPEFFWYSDRDEFFEFLSSCHVGVLPSSIDTARRIGIPKKLFDYMSVGLPIVANDIGTWTNIIKEEQLGILTEDNLYSFAEGIQTLLQNESLALECGRRGLKLIKAKFNSKKSARILLNEYKKCLMC